MRWSEVTSQACELARAHAVMRRSKGLLWKLREDAQAAYLLDIGSVDAEAAVHGHESFDGARASTRGWQS